MFLKEKKKKNTNQTNKQKETDNSVHHLAVVLTLLKGDRRTTVFVWEPIAKKGKQNIKQQKKISLPSGCREQTEFWFILEIILILTSTGEVWFILTLTTEESISLNTPLT